MSRAVYSLLRRLSPPDDASSDAAVLRRFTNSRDETAFELLVWRHGGLVLGACRRILRDDHLAEDAFQATFLILARKAGSVRGSLAGWLHQVARRVCIRARKRNPVPLEPGSEVGVNDADPLFASELRGVLDEEIARLPAKQRLVVLLCYLQGRSTDDAAKVLGIPRGTVLSRLDTARKRLQHALTARGVTVPVTLFAAAISCPELSADMCRLGTTTALGFATASTASSLPTQLAHEVMHMTTRKTALGVMAALLVTAGVGTGVGLVMAQSGGKVPDTKVAEKPDAEPPKPLSLETKPTADEIELRTRAKRRAERMDELGHSQQKVSKQIEGLDARKEKELFRAAEEVDPKILQERITEVDKSILTAEDEIEMWGKEKTELRIKQLMVRRGQLMARILRVRSAQNAQQLIDDEIQVLRDIRKQVLRERLMLEMGLEDKAK